ncbi:DUF1352 domain-containing protein [Cephalotus follicularis]|uniref:DUF1352 domain-containing protein n=1 Tax=Cephalotus follicularis TaxID=3775 RepID=A0A1Q3BA22_CEPFO|nr:DUF1352 domain-containing protein [Cephalotus follicularis]
MHQRKSEFGRPSGTDGSDFSYRMVVDSRYQKVAKKKKILSSIIGIQVIFQLVGLSYILLSVSKGESPDALAISSALVSLISLIIGELGRRRSRVNLLRIYMVGSSVAMILSMFGVIGSKLTLEVTTFFFFFFFFF